MAVTAGDYVCIRLSRTLLADYQQRGVFPDLPKVPGEYLRPVAVARQVLADAQAQVSVGRHPDRNPVLSQGGLRAYTAVVRHLTKELELDVPLCKAGWNFHVFGLGADRCSTCGWTRTR